MKPALRVTILLSLLFHLLVFTPWLLKDATPLPEKPLSTTVELTLQPQAKKTPPQPEQPVIEQAQDTPPPSRHLEDDITKSNTLNGTAETPTGKPLSPTQGEPTANESTEQDIAEDSSPRPASRRSNPNSPRLSDYLKAQDIAKQQKKRKGLNLDVPTEADAASNLIESTLNQEEEERARWYNEVLKRIEEQVNYVWVKPTGLSRDTWGIIRLSISQYGYLEEARVHLSSGHAQLDRSAMRAVRQVQRYDIPHSPNLSRYYRNLEFRYSGGEPTQ